MKTEFPYIVRISTVDAAYDAYAWVDNNINLSRWYYSLKDNINGTIWEFRFRSQEDAVLFQLSIPDNG